MGNAHPKPKPEAVVVIFVSRKGVREVQVHAPRQAQAQGVDLYCRIRPAVDRLDRIARGGKPIEG